MKAFLKELQCSVWFKPHVQADKSASTQQIQHMWSFHETSNAPSPSLWLELNVNDVIHLKLNSAAIRKQDGQLEQFTEGGCFQDTNPTIRI